MYVCMYVCIYVYMYYILLIFECVFCFTLNHFKSAKLFYRQKHFLSFLNVIQNFSCSEIKGAISANPLFLFSCGDTIS